MATIQPYLFFGGRCEEAIEFYREALGAELEMKMLFKDSPAPVPPGMLQDGFEGKVMHASFRVGDSTVLASDGCDDKSKFDGFRLAASLESVDAVRRAFDALAVGGTVQMPLVQTFWSPLYGMVTDRFGVGWMVMVRAEG